MKPNERNLNLPSDNEMAQELRNAAGSLADAMTKADRMGIDVSFASIQKGQNGRFAVLDLNIRKRLTD